MSMVLEAGLEPARPYEHYPLKIACLPIPPLQQRGLIVGIIVVLAIVSWCLSRLLLYG